MFARLQAGLASGISYGQSQLPGFPSGTNCQLCQGLAGLLFFLLHDVVRDARRAAAGAGSAGGSFAGP